MKIQQNITIFTGDTQNNAQAERAKGAQASSEKGKAIYAGNMLTEFSLRDRIQQRKAQARERAMKIVGDAWDGDRKIAEQLQQSRDRLRDLRASYKDAQDNIKALSEQSDALMEYYQVDADSEEQQDLELLKKAQGEMHRWSGIELTEEEREKLAEIEGKGLTEYQKRVLELDETAWEYRLAAYKAGRDIETENAVIRGVRLERLKKDPMLKAGQQAEDVMEASRDEIIGMVTEEAKDHLNQEQEKKEEEAQAIKEKKEEQEEILEKRKEREDGLEELMEDMPLQEMADLKNVQAEIRQEVQNIVNKMNLVAEDIKGAQVDASL